jgi:hypothetical protein
MLNLQAHVHSSLNVVVCNCCSYMYIYIYISIASVKLFLSLKSIANFVYLSILCAQVTAEFIERGVQIAAQLYTTTTKGLLVHVTRIEVSKLTLCTCC